MKILLLLATLLTARADSPNLLRNGSFEGCLLYWHNIDPKLHTLVKDAKNGQHALRIEKGSPMSAPFVCEKGKDYTVSFWVKGDKDGEVRVQMPPSAREEGVNHKRLWTAEATKAEKIGTEWKRVAFTWPADVPQTGFWPLPHYMVQIEATVPVLVDGVAVQEGKGGAKDYVPRGMFEILAECPSLPGYTANGNVLQKGARVRLTLHAHGTGKFGKEPVGVPVRWRLTDYEGNPLTPWTRKGITIPDGGTASESIEVELSASGCVLFQVQAAQDRLKLDGTGEGEVQGDGALLFSECVIPLTTLPYPKAATKPDYRERFGGSFAGGIGMVKKLQSIGMSWIRWRPHCNGHDHLPKEPADKTKPETWEWKWFDKELDEQEAHGFSSHLVLYPPPLWVMENEHGGHPLPKDMRWPADDPRWEDLSVMTVWDHFVEQAVKHYAKRSVVFEIENEPEFDQWTEHKLGAEYAKFTMRTARLIKKTAPQAKVMVNNVYGIPSAVNSGLFKTKDGLKDVDILSWHDYHAGWLADATTIKRFRQNLDEAGGKHVAIWFNEGWAFTNTAVDEPPACTGLTSAQSTNAIMASVAEMTVAGQEKTVLFHTGYETHGMSFWDYSGPGTQLWDWYGNPLPLVAAWNVMAHHISLSEPIGLIRPPGCNLAVFQDLRNNRGVIVGYADRDSKENAKSNLPIPGLRREDIMGNVEMSGLMLGAPRSNKEPWTPSKQIAQFTPVTFSKSGQLQYFYRDGLSGKELYAALEKMDRKHQGFASTTDGALSFTLPATWEGTAKGKADGNPVAANGKSVWALYRLWPADAKMAANWTPMVWEGTRWNAPDHTQGGHASATVEGGGVKFGVMGPWGGNEFNYPKTGALAFIAPADGTWRITAKASVKPWDGGAKEFPLAALKKDTQRAAEVQSCKLPRDGTAVTLDFTVALSAGHELLLAPMTEHLHNNAGTVTIESVTVRKE